MDKTQLPIVYVVEDDYAICNALEWLFKTINLNSQIFVNGQECLNNYKSDWYGCFLIDIRMPIMGGLELQERLNELNNKLPIIFITGHGDIPLAVRAMKSGAFDFVTKPFNNQILLEQIQKAIETSKQRMNKIDKKFIEGYKKLTRRELEVLECIIAGQLSKKIAVTLNISISTVELHRSNLMQKLSVKSVVDLVKNYILHQSELVGS